MLLDTGPPMRFVILALSSANTSSFTNCKYIKCINMNRGREVIIQELFMSTIDSGDYLSSRAGRLVVETATVAYRWSRWASEQVCSQCQNSAIHFNCSYKESLFYKVKVTLRPTVSRPVHLGVRHPSGTRDQFFPLSLWLLFRQFRVCWCGVPSLTRSRACSFQLLPGNASAAFLRSESHRIHEHSLLSLFFKTPLTWRARFL
jgi:hypothetical protein